MLASFPRSSAVIGALVALGGCSSIETDTSPLSGADGCVASTCAQFGAECGTVADGCGGQLSCGTCQAPATCGGAGLANRCGQAPCVPETDAQLCALHSRACGPLLVSDRCGATRDLESCGSCAANYACSSSPAPGVCVQSCHPETQAQFCTRLGARCGALSGKDNCGKARAVASCGTCTSGTSCGGGGSANVCGATNCAAESNAAFCARYGKACGSFAGADNCGTSRSVTSCGSCSGSSSCGGGGTPNQCGCAGESDAQFCGRLGKNCGTLTATDNCGATRSASCGTCSGSQTCGGNGAANVCGCSPETSSQFCSRLGKSCGAASAADNCGSYRTVGSCGTCPSSQTCNSGVCSCTSESDSQFCARLGKACGSVSAADNCGVARTVSSCGTCAAPKTCGGGGTANVCACGPETDAQICTRLGKNCGSLYAYDNCGSSRTVTCGTCAAPAVCGAVTANVCACIAEANTQFCARQGKSCGSVTAADNCGTSRTVASCGTCGANAICGLTAPNVCGGYSEIFNPICNPEGWCWEHPKPFGNSVYDVQVLSANDIWAVGSENLILHYDGSAWSGTFDGKRPTLRALWARNASDVWAVGNAATVLRWQGSSWTPVTVPASSGQDFTAIYGFGASDVWIGTNSIVKHFDGSTWTPFSVPGAVTALWGAASNDLWAVGTSGTGGFMTHWNGTAWTTQSGANYAYKDVYGFSANDIWAVAPGHVARWNGTYWADAANYDCSSVWGSNAGNLWFACGDKLKHYDGSSFTDSLSGTYNIKVGGDSTGARIAVSLGGWMARYTSGQWVQMAPTQLATTNTIDSVRLFAGGGGIAHVRAQKGNFVRRSGAWAVETENVVYNKCVWGASPSDYWIGSGDSDTHRRPLAYHKLGTSLIDTNLSSFTNLRYPEIRAMWGSGATDVHAVGQTYWSYYSGSYSYSYGFFHFDGTSWTATLTNAMTDTNSDSVLSFIDGTSATNVWAADNLNTIWRLLNGSWQRFTTGSPLTTSDSIAGVRALASTRVYFLGTFGVVPFDNATGFGAKQPVPDWTYAGSVVRGIAQSASAGLIAVGDNGLGLGSSATPKGVTWSWNGTAWQVQSVFASGLYGIDVDGNQLIAVGAGGAIYKKP